MKILIACEYSGKMRRAFQAKGHDVISCDLLPADDGSPNHVQTNVLNLVRDEHWDMMIAHPPCTFLSNSGVGWLRGKDHVDTEVNWQDEPLAVNGKRWTQMLQGAKFFADLLGAPIDKIAVENPVMHKYARGAISDFLRHPMPKMHFVQPWWFGHEAFKATGFALKNLPPLTKPATALTPPKPGTPEHKEWTSRIHGLPPSADRWKIRSTTFDGVAEAAAEAWG